MVLPNVAVKVKTFESKDIEKLEMKINNFLEEVDTGSLLDIKFSTFQNNYSAMIMYIDGAFIVEDGNLSEADDASEVYPEGKTHDFDE